MEHAQHVGRVFFPLDEELGLLPGNLAPRQHEHLVHLASWMPFAWAVQMLEHLLGVQVSEETVRRLTEQAGAQVEAVQTAQAKEPLQEEPQEQTSSTHLAISADGACVPLLHGEWAEVRTVAIGEVEERCTAEGEHQIHVGQVSYFSRLTDAETFADLAEVEMRRRKVIQAEQVCAVTDGADWLQGFVDLHRSDAVRILDFPHAAEHVSDLLHALEQMGHHFPAQMLERCLHVLKHRGPDPLLRMSQRLSSDLTELAGVREHLGYLRKRQGLMQYPQFRRQGWPIGSGMVESANKLVVEARLKGAGMHWERSHVNPLLALRNGVCNQRWQETWHLAVAHQHAQQRQCRTARAEQRKQAQLSSPAPLPVESSSAAPSAPLEEKASRMLPVPAATLPGSCRPSAHHPWKRGPACVTKRFAKL
jgi:Uncharacterised protein family (UPF0236)